MAGVTVFLQTNTLPSNPVPQAMHFLVFSKKLSTYQTLFFEACPDLGRLQA
jgi:hypothetical protein